MDISSLASHLSFVQSKWTKSFVSLALVYYELMVVSEIYLFKVLFAEQKVEAL